MMKTTLKTHALWTATAVISFGLGWKLSNPSTSLTVDEAAEAQKSQKNSQFSEDDTAGSANRREKRTADSSENSALGRLFGLISSADGNLDPLINQALRDPNPIARRLAFSKLLESMTAENAASMREKLVAIGTSPDQLRDFHYAWGALDGQAAFDSASNSPERDLASTMTGWAAANPSAALAMLDHLPEKMEGQREEIVASVVDGLADNNQALATDFVLKLAREGNQQAANLIGRVANETLRTEGPEGASLWTKSLPDGPLKGTAMGQVANAYVNKDPEAAARWVGEYSGKDYASNAIERTGVGWARTNPVAAVGWMETLPASNGQSSGLRNAFSDWEDSDPAAASQYLTNMRNSPQRDSSISGFATGYAWQNPQLSIEWAQEISDPALRERSLTQVGQAYYQRDPNNAEIWMANSGLPQAALEEMKQPRQRRR